MSHCIAIKTLKGGFCEIRGVYARPDCQSLTPREDVPPREDALVLVLAEPVWALSVWVASSPSRSSLQFPSVPWSTRVFGCRSRESVWMLKCFGHVCSLNCNFSKEIRNPFVKLGILIHSCSDIHVQYRWLTCLLRTPVEITVAGRWTLGISILFPQLDEWITFLP